MYRAWVLAWTTVLLIALAPAPIAAQEVDPFPDDSAGARPYHLEVSGFFHQLDGEYGSWNGGEVRLQRRGQRLSPSISLATQTRPEGSQQAISAASYVILNEQAYLILGAGGALGGTANFYPQLRWDLTGLLNVPGVSGLVVSAGVTQVRFAQSAGATTLSLGSLYYLPEAILQGVVRFNEDRLSGAGSRFVTMAGQMGREGSSWTGGSIGWGNEAYTVLGAIPVDARFEGVTATVFHRRWLTARKGFILRSEMERKGDAYIRIGLTGGVFLEL